MYKVKVTGLFIARSPNSEREKVKKNYEIEGVIPTLVAALSVVKNKLLSPALTKKYPDYITYLTYHIISITPLTPEAEQKMSAAEIQFMDRPTLVKYIKDHALPVLEKYYPDMLKLREAVQHAKEDPTGYEKSFAFKKEDLALDLAMAAANPDLFSSDQIPTEPITPTAQETPKAKASSQATLRRKTEDRVKGLAADQKRDGEIGPADDEGL
jgi:hypothetical protein